MDTLKQMGRRVLKWLLWLMLAVILFIFVILCFFSLQAGYREAKNSAEAAPSAGKFVQAGDVKVFYQESGRADAPAVLLVHGTGAWSEIWRETMTALTKNDFHVIAIDVPPFGYSEKPRGSPAYSRENQAKRIIGVLDALHIERVILVGHSVGARPTIEAALEAPHRVQSLILVDPALGFAANENDNPHFEQNNPSWIMRTLFTLHPLRNAMLATYGTNPLSTKSLFRSFVSDVSAVTDERVYMLQQPLIVKDTTRAYGDWLEYLIVSHDASLASNFENFKNLHIPVLIMWGSKDTVTPLWQGEKLKQLIPGSKLVVIDRVGHIPYIENAKEFNNALLHFLTRQGGR